MLNENQIKEQYDKLNNAVENFIGNPRKDKIYNMFQKYEERLLLCPSSTSKFYFATYPGGLLYYINKVIDMMLETNKIWVESGFQPDYTKEEMIFSAIFHNFGKIGDEKHDYYIKETSDWYKKTYGRVYKINPEISYMKVTDRSLFLLNREGVIYTQNEFYGIKLSHGIYDKSTESYFVNYSKDFTLNTHLHIVLNQASLASTNIISQLDSEENKTKENLQKNTQEKKWGRPSKADKTNDLDFDATFGKSSLGTNESHQKKGLNKDLFDDLFPDPK